MEISAEVDLVELSWALSKQLTHEELLSFIVDLDLMVADWDFTESLYKWAKGEHKALKAEKKEYS